MNTIEATDAAGSREPVTYWISEDGQREIDMSGAPACEALLELLQQAGDDIAEKADILAGSFQPLETVVGTDAIAYARQWSHLVLCKHADPVEDAREGLTVDEAEEVAAEDPSLIWVKA